MSRGAGPGEKHSGPAGDLAQALAAAAADLAERQPGRAEARLLEALERHPEAAAAWDALGRARNNLRRLPEAEAAFREALRHDPRLASAWNHLGHVLRATGRTDEARQTFREGIAAAEKKGDFIPKQEMTRKLDELTLGSSENTGNEGK